jgi:hypothetical protein
VVIDQVGFSGADVSRALNLNPAAIDKLILRARNDPAQKVGVNDMLYSFLRFSFGMKVEILSD